MTVLLKVDPKFKMEAQDREQQQSRKLQHVFDGENAVFNRVELINQAIVCLERLHRNQQSLLKRAGVDAEGADRDDRKDDSDRDKQVSLASAPIAGTLLLSCRCSLFSEEQVICAAVARDVYSQDGCFTRRSRGHIRPRGTSLKPGRLQMKLAFWREPWRSTKGTSHSHFLAIAQQRLN